MSVEPSSIQRGARKGRMGLGMIVAVIVVVAGVAGGTIYFLFFAQGRDIVRVDGSSTVFPITSSWATEFNKQSPNRQVVVGFVGTGAGFAKFCRGEIDISDASRPIRQSEMDMCTANGITGIVEFLVAYDGLSVVINPANTFVQNLTVTQLCRIWTSNETAGACGGAGPRATTWQDLNAAWPAQDIDLYGPGTDSGTFDYFVEVILDPFDETITDQFFPSEDDNRLVQGVASSQYSLGYFGYAYAIDNQDQVKIVPIDDENPDSNEDGTPDIGSVLPTEVTVRDGTYAPLARPLYVYSAAGPLQRTIVKDFLRFGLSTPGMTLVDATGYVSLNAEELAASRDLIPP